MNIGSITFSGITQVKNKITYNGVECMYVGKGFGEYWIQPLSANETINECAGMGKLITKQELDNLLTNQNNKP